MNTSRITHVDAIFGQVVVSLRKKKGMGQDTLSKLLGINQPALSRLERGESAVNMAMLLNLSEAFKIPAAELIKELENAKHAVEHEAVKIVPKKEVSNGVALALLGAAALALLISR